MFPTPDLRHLTSEDYNHIYEPAEDTFLLMDALEKDVELLKSAQPSICLEVGSGSGAPLAFLSQLISSFQFQPICFATDLNSRAAAATRATAARNRSDLVEPIVTDLIGPFLTRLQSSVDVLVFNPPYVPTPPEEVGARGIAASWAGGERGRLVTDRLLPLVPNLLSKPIGLFYLVAVPENDPEEIVAALEAFALTGEKILERRAGREKLAVYRFRWST